DRGRSRRGLEPLSEAILALDERRRTLIARLQAGQERRNAASKEIGQAKAHRDEAGAQSLMAEVAALKAGMPADEDALRSVEAALRVLVASLPNLPLDDVPDGVDEHGNVERYRHGLPRGYDFAPKEHFDLGESLGLMDFEAGASLSGSRFVVL